MQNRREKYFALGFIFVIATLAGIWIIPSAHPASVRVSAMGGTLAFFGVVIMALPVLRVGPFQWILNLHFEDIKKDFSQSPTTETELKDREDQRTFDLLIQNIIGPYMIGIGTFVNGISGFFK